MDRLTLTEIGEDFGALSAAAREAEAQGLRVGLLLGLGGYSAVFEAHPEGLDPCVLKIPWVHHGIEEHPDVTARAHGPNRIRLVSLTGPFVLGAPRSLNEAARLLTAACIRQRERVGPVPLARLLRTVDLAGLPGALIERVHGSDFRRLMTYHGDDARASLPQLAGALAHLHETFGGHGDLKPEHIFLSDSGVKFIDALCDAEWVGSVGYTLGRVGQRFSTGGPEEEEADRLTDLAALAAMIFELWGAYPEWDGRLAYLIANQGNGRFGSGLDWEAVEARFLEAGTVLPVAYQGWTASVGGAYFAALRGEELPPEGWGAGRLAELTMRR